LKIFAAVFHCINAVKTKTTKMQGEGLEYGDQVMDEEIREREMARVWQKIQNE
jgi:hypothetical protein